MKDEQQRCRRCKKFFPLSDFIGQYGKPVVCCKSCLRIRRNSQNRWYADKALAKALANKPEAKVQAEGMGVREYQRAYRKKSLAEYKKENRCPRCKKIFPPSGFIGVSGKTTVWCRACMDRQNAFNRATKRKSAPIEYERVQKKVFYTPSDLMRMSPEKLARATTAISRGDGKVADVEGEIEQ